MMVSLRQMCNRLPFILRSSLLKLPSLYSRSFVQIRLCSNLVDFKNNDFDQFEDSIIEELLENVDFNEIIGQDDKKRKALHDISMMIQTQALPAPKKLTPDQWHNLIHLETKKERLHYLRYFYIKEKRLEVKAENVRAKRENYQKMLEAKTNEGENRSTDSPLCYSLLSNSLFYRVQNRFIRTKYNFNAALGMILGPDIILDCSYEEYMTTSELFDCTNHIMYIRSSNRESKNPFNVICCNMNPNGRIMQGLIKRFNGTLPDDFLITFTDRHYLDLYPPERLIYLTPHCKEDVVEYESDSVYILGSFVDSRGIRQVSPSKAQKDGLRTARLPLDKYLNWSQGAKVLPINQCFNILNDLKDGEDWNYALRKIAVRKQKFQFTTGEINHRKGTDLATYVRECVNKSIAYDIKATETSNKDKPHDSLSSID